MSKRYTPPRHVATQLGFALLGLLQQEPRSGYALMRLFASTPLRHFSDSPGSIYPALRRLQAAGFVSGAIEGERPLRPRQVFRVTPAGRAALRAWLTAPITPRDVEVQGDKLMLRLSLMTGAVDLAAIQTYLRQFQRALAELLAPLQSFYRVEGKGLALSGRLALRGGIQGLADRLRWVKAAQREVMTARKKGDR